MDGIIHELWYNDLNRKEELSKMNAAHLDKLWNIVRVSLEDFENSLDDQIKKWRVHMDKIIVRAENF